MCVFMCGRLPTPARAHGLQPRDVALGDIEVDHRDWRVERGGERVREGRQCAFSGDGGARSVGLLPHATASCAAPAHALSSSSQSASGGTEAGRVGQGDGAVAHGPRRREHFAALAVRVGIHLHRAGAAGNGLELHARGQAHAAGEPVRAQPYPLARRPVREREVAAHAAPFAEVGLQHAHAASMNRVFELAQAEQVLAGGQPHRRRGVGQRAPGRPRRVGAHRLLAPQHLRRGQARQPSARALDAPALVHVDHQLRGCRQHGARCRGCARPPRRRSRA
ncbi:MAG: hypothetical protein U1F49_17830 [Rubrivivax sp.]